MKEYAVTEDVLNNMGSLCVSATLWAAVGSLALGFALSAWVSLDLAGTDVDAAARLSWEAYRNIGFIAALCAYNAAAYYAVRGKSVIEHVKEGTVPDEVD